MMQTSLQCFPNTFAVRTTFSLSQQIHVKTLMLSLIQSENWSEAQAWQACQRYLGFLYLVWLYPDRLLVPTQEIDCVWHCHILHTRQYRQDCQILFGSYLDHDPCSVQIPDSSIWFAQTKVLFEQHFGIGSFEGDLSNDPAACGKPVI